MAEPEKLRTNIKGAELVWEGKRTEAERIPLPFQIIETINQSRATREETPLLAGLPPPPLFEGVASNKDVWRNKLIWGDNKYVLASLLKEGFAGKINLIYIDPPFATGADFSINMKVGDAEWTKEASIIEEKAYRDTWGKGLDSYLQMLYERLALMRDLLSETGSIYVHLDWRMNSYLRLILNEILGENNFQSEIYWKRTTARAGSSYYNNVVDNILFYTKSQNARWNQLYSEYSEEYLNTMFRGRDENGRRYRESPLTAPGRTKGQSGQPWRGVDPNKVGKGRHWAIPGYVLKELSEEAKKDTLLALEELDKLGRIVWSSLGTPNIKQYQDELEGVELQNIWLDIGIAKGTYPTQKPEELLERIIRASSNPGDLVADFFCGSGTTLAVAEKLGRRWIGCDLGRFAIHTTRKRLLDIPDCQPFEILNLGKYERKYWQMNGIKGRQKDTQKAIFEYLEFIIKLYHAEPVIGFSHLHGRKAGRMVHVGATDAPVTLSEIIDALEECSANKLTALDILGWEWEMGLHDVVGSEARRRGIDLRLLNIPREVMDRRAVEAGDVHFYELAYVEAEVRQRGTAVQVALKDFIIPSLELVPIEVRDKVKKWSDYIDYWAVDWDFKEDTFHNQWQSYRTRKHSTLATESDWHNYPSPGAYKLLVKVVDIFGNDTTKLLEVKA